MCHKISTQTIHYHPETVIQPSSCTLPHSGPQKPSTAIVIPASHPVPSVTLTITPKSSTNVSPGPETPKSTSHSIPNKAELVDSLVATAASLIESIWPPKSPTLHKPAMRQSLAPLPRVIQELLRRSRTSCSALQLSLFYLLRLRNALRSKYPQAKSEHMVPQLDSNSPLRCGRRMFLTALILANKFLQDKNYSHKAWSKICGLAPAEICKNEMEFLHIVEWNLYVDDAVWKCWSRALWKKSLEEYAKNMLVHKRRLLEQAQRNKALVSQWLENIQQCHSLGSQGLVPQPPSSAARPSSGLHTPHTSDIFPPSVNQSLGSNHNVPIVPITPPVDPVESFVLTQTASAAPMMLNLDPNPAFDAGLYGSETVKVAGLKRSFASDHSDQGVLGDATETVERNSKRMRRGD